jgi:hypothetical protein
MGIPLRNFVGQALLVPNGVITTSDPGLVVAKSVSSNPATASFASENRFIVNSERDTGIDE